jgi:hypothetical protein
MPNQLAIGPDRFFNDAWQLLLGTPNAAVRAALTMSAA